MKICFTDIAESKDSSGSEDLSESSAESEASGELEESGESGESGEAEYKRNYIPRESDDAEDDDDDNVESKNEVSSEGEQQGSAEQYPSTRGKVITETMDDIAKAALDNKIERKSDIIHSLPQNTEDSPGNEKEPNAETKEKKTGAALKNLFTALADGEVHASGSGEELALKEKAQSSNLDKRVSLCRGLGDFVMILALNIYFVVFNFQINSRGKYM